MMNETPEVLEIDKITREKDGICFYAGEQKVECFRGTAKSVCGHVHNNIYSGNLVKLPRHQTVKILPEAIDQLTELTKNE